MIHDPYRSRRFEFSVRLGFESVRVRGATPAEAIVAARRQIAASHPRMWDVIHTAPSERFVVEPVSDSFNPEPQATGSGQRVV